MAPFDLPRLKLPIVEEYARPEPLFLVERPANKVFEYRQAHAFISHVENVRVIGWGSLVNDEGIYAHNVTTGNYADNIRIQLGGYKEVPQGPSIEGEHVLVWGHENFGHWIITYLMRLVLLWMKSDLRSHSLLLREGLPKRYVEWLKRMGFSRFRYVPDGAMIEKLWVPSVVCYRGNYEDMMPYIWPQALMILRQLILKDLIFPHPVRTKLYISRERSKWRKMDNEDELHQALPGYRRVFMSEHTLEQQLDMVSRAESIVIHAGGDSPITMFAPMDCRIIELSVPQFAGTFASRCWAHVLGQKFYRIDGVPTTNNGSLQIDSNCVIDVKKVLEVV